MSDLVESHPGALPQANPVARARFERSALKMYEEKRQLELHERVSSNVFREEEREKRVTSLCEMFPALDRSLIAQLLDEQEGCTEKTCEVLLKLGGGLSIK